jgi:hypothetical protein
MTQINLLMQAKAGNPVAIALLINRRMSTQGVTAKVTRQHHHLKILLESREYIPSKKKATRYLSRALTQLDPVALTKVKLYGRRAGMPTVAWVEEIDLVNLAAPTPQFALDAMAAAETKTSTPSSPEAAGIHSDPTVRIEDPPADAAEEQSSALKPPAFWWLWLQWQMTNLKGGLLLVFTLWLVGSLMFFVLGQFLQQVLGIAMGLSLLMGIPISLLVGGLWLGESQASFLAPYLLKPGHWRWATCFGFGLGCALATGVQFAGYTLSTLALFTLLPLTPLLVAITITLSGMLLGGMVSLWQWLVLRHTVKPSYSWLFWNVFAGGMSALIALLGGGLGARWVAHELPQLGWLSSQGAGVSLLVYALVASVLAWLSYHAISGIKMARFLQKVSKCR